ncbi:MAG: asparagine synthase (glutamine-hydrolyzing) [Lentisphaerae bacterium GWF2_45_14]|nr:MAG: asparagine synthase (glutamine-hydrolyzing) [Lentisphaerae bacterium GWF2_45_14]
MCGIAGEISLNGKVSEKSSVPAMLNAMRHRGPDDEGIFNSGPVTIGQRRLSIVGIKNGHQPISNEDKSAWTVCNGEIYNYPELKEDLESRGHIFGTSTDSEVIVHLYEEYGTEMTSHLEGMFAFAIYDTKKSLILLARDRVGKKPLYYFRRGNIFAFASELRALACHEAMPRDLSLQALSDYFSFQYVPQPGTIFEDVFKLQPAHQLELKINDNGGIRIKRYWTLSYATKSDAPYTTASKELKGLVTESIRARLMSDVPYGVFLSGGVDSTIIAGVMAEICESPVKAFSIGFDDPLYDERKFAEAAVKHINAVCGANKIEHIVKVVKPDDFESVKALALNFGEPYCDASMLPTFLLSRFTREHVKVALSGDGADELFAGYNRYLALKCLQYIELIPQPLRRTLFNAIGKILPQKTEERTALGTIQRMLKAAASDSAERYFGLICRFDEDAKSSVYGKAFTGQKLTDSRKFLDALISSATAHCQTEKIMEAEFHSYLPCDILPKVDIASMAASLEVRCPFLDRKIVEFAAALPFDFKQNRFTRKKILVDSFHELIPEIILNRPKKGFGTPLASWFRGPWREILKSHLLEGKAVELGYLKREGILTMLNSHVSMKADYSYQLWAMLIFELFLENLTAGAI